MILRTIRSCLVAVLLSASAASAAADDISLQVGGRFSLYVPASCTKADRGSFALVLNCNFRGKSVAFYLKEFPGQLGDEFDPRAYPPATLNKEAYQASVFRAILDDLDRSMTSRIKVMSKGSTTGDDTDARFHWDGYLYRGNNERQFDGKCIFFWVQTYRRGWSGVVAAIADADGLTQSGDCVGVPPEVRTILSSLGTLTEGGRSGIPR
jgi:hypothetical protein